MIENTLTQIVYDWAKELDDDEETTFRFTDRRRVHTGFMLTVTEQNGDYHARVTDVNGAPMFFGGPFKSEADAVRISNQVVRNIKGIDSL